jgi:hypothetical protein
VANFHYGIGPWVWNATDQCWQPPAGAVCALDLRSLPDASIPTLGTNPHGFFGSLDALGGDYAALGVGDCRELASSSAMRDAWEALLGYRPSGSTLLDLLWDHLTNGADPEGQDRCKPLIPTISGTLDLHLPGHSLVRRELFTRAHPHWNQVSAVLQSDMGRMHAEYDALARGKGASESARLRDVPAKVLGGLCQKYRIDMADTATWRLLLPPQLRATLAPKKPETSVADSFNRSNNADLNASDTGKTLNGSAATWQWTDVQGTEGAIDSNQMRATNSFTGYAARAETDLSSADMRTVSRRVGQDDASRLGVVYARYSAAANTAYAFYQRASTSSTHRLFKVVAGVETQIGSTVNAGATLTLPYTFGVVSSGSSITAEKDGSAIVGPVTDTAITGHVRSGLGVRAIGGSGLYVALDDFLAEDLVASVGRMTHSLCLMGVQ